MEITLVFQICVRVLQWRIGLLREYASGLIHQPRLAEKFSGEELQVEAGLAYEFIRNRLIQINCDHKSITISFQSNGIGQLDIRIEHRVESCSMA